MERMADYKYPPKIELLDELPKTATGKFLRRKLRDQAQTKAYKKETNILVFVDIKVNPKGLSLDELWKVWEEQTKAALGAMEAGKIVTLYKVSGQRRVIGILDIESTDELDQIIYGRPPNG